MPRATDKNAFLDIVEREYPDLLQAHRELLDRLELPSNQALGIRIVFHGADAQTPTYHVYADPASAERQAPYTHALRVHTGGNVYVVWKGNVPDRLGQELRSAFEGLTKSPENLDGSQVELGNTGGPFEIERCLRRAVRAAGGA